MSSAAGRRPGAHPSARRGATMALCLAVASLWCACRNPDEVRAQVVPTAVEPDRGAAVLDGGSATAPIAPDAVASAPDSVTAQAEASPQPTPTRATPTTCTYATYAWSVEKKTGVDRRTVSKAYSEVTDDERDPADPRCTVCSEDQVEIRPAELGLDGVEPFQVCYVYEADVVSALKSVVADGSFSIHEVVGYRCGRTRGKVVDGLRTEWSNHAFGTAVDLNADHNGLYGNCDVAELSVAAMKDCKLRVGGKWDPQKRPRTTIVKSSAAYQAFTRFWKWGGEIEGTTRDLMHFSNTGY